ncbi:MAG: LacI family DNA-binding transcriptional regulator [Rectinemataceae bacterium]|jgi:DNA-binding LacI/PurR family transcriptional regulator
MAVIKDVARLAGVSTGTVSKYFSNPDTLKEENRKKIETVVRELKYRPSNIARSLRTQKTNLIALIVPDIVNPFYASVYDAVRLAASQYKYKPILYTTEDDLEILKDYLEGDYIHEVDGIILCFLDEDEIVSDFESIQARIPLVLLSWDMNTKTDSVVVDLFEGVNTATKHIIQLGHRDIAYVGGPANSRISKEKQKGFEKALAEAGIGFKAEYFHEGRYRFQTGYEAARGFLRLPNPPTAIVAANDAIAIGCMKYLLQKGLRIPDDVAVIGLDDQPIAAMYEPALSTVSIPIADMGPEAVRMLIKRIEKPHSQKRKLVLKMELILRGSTDKKNNRLAEF